MAKKWVSDFGQKHEIHILVKNTIFLSSFSMAFIDLTNIFVTAAKILNFYCEKMDFRFWSKIRDSLFSQKYDFSFQFFDRSLAK